jgi:hypothetical protein
MWFSVMFNRRTEVTQAVLGTITGTAQAPLKERKEQNLNVQRLDSALFGPSEQ